MRTSVLITDIIDQEGEIAPTLEAEMKDLSIQQASKIDAYHFMFEQLKLQAAYFREQARKYQKVAQRLEDAEERIRTYLKTLMIQFQQPEISGHEVRFKLSPGPKKLLIDSPPEVPVDYQRVVMEIDNARVKADLMEGKTIPGCRLESTVTLRTYPNTKRLRGSSHD